MPKFFIKWLVTAGTILAIPHLVTGVYIDGLGTALAVAAVLALLNLLVRPLLVLVTLPLTLVSLGFFLLVINAFLFKLTASFVMGFAIDSFSSAFFASLILSAVSWICNLSLNKDSGRIKFEVRRPERPSQRRVIDLNSDQQGNWS
ncbi:MAG: phage holin family protein [Deltaproteobacteria bacterium]